MSGFSVPLKLGRLAKYPPLSTPTPPAAFDIKVDRKSKFSVFLLAIATGCRAIAKCTLAIGVDKWGSTSGKLFSWCCFLLLMHAVPLRSQWEGGRRSLRDVLPFGSLFRPTPQSTGRNINIVVAKQKRPQPGLSKSNRNGFVAKPSCPQVSR
jgi:hypothetical protein